MTENEKQEAFDKWYGENYDEWAEGEEGIALREELEQAFKGGIAELKKENAELSMKRKAERKIFQGIVEKKNDQLTKAKEIIKELVRVEYADFTNGDYSNELSKVLEQAEQFLKETE